MNQTGQLKSVAIGVMGAIAGGVIGFFVFRWLLSQGFYAMVVPGACVGFGGGMLARDRSPLRAVLCGSGALGLGLFAEWHFRPFAADDGLGYFLTHLHHLQPITMVMILAGAAFGAWLALGKPHRLAPPPPPAEPPSPSPSPSA